MKKIILVLALCLLGALLFAQERVAVLPFTGGEGSEGNTLARMLGQEFTKLGYFQIVPSTADIENVMKEQNIQRGGLTDGDTIAELGREANAKYVVSGHIQSFGNRKMISASIVDVETFQQVSGDYYEYDDLSEVREYLPILAEELASKTEKDYSGVPTLAILPFDGVTENNADILAQLLAIELANSGKYVVVSRTTTIENVMKEQNIQRSELTDSNTISQIGKTMNADYVLYGSVASLGSSVLMNVTIIDVLTQVQEKVTYVEYKTIANGVILMPELSYDLTGIITRYIGRPGPGGGMIFYIDGDKYLECSEVLGEVYWNEAKTLVEDYRGGGYDDWYLPNRDELNLIYENLRMKGYISGDELWSSSEYYSGGSYAWGQDFSNGLQSGYHRNSSGTNVRAIRDFNY